MGSHDDITAAPHDADKSNASTAGSLPFYGGGDKGVNALTQLQEVTVRGEDADVALAQMGYTPQLKRNRNQLTIQCLLLTLFAVPFGVSSGFYTGLIGGGPVCLIWGFLLVGVLQECIAISLGEIQSQYPTSGGPYYWSYVLAPNGYRVVLSYVTGWLYMLAICMLNLGTHFGVANLIMGAVNISFPDYVAPAYVVLLIAYAMFIMSVLVTWKGGRFVPILDAVNAAFTALLLVTLFVVLISVAAEGRNSAKFVFTHYDYSFSGWGEGWTFFIGLLPGCFVMCGIGLITSMSEEVAKPSIQIPRAMVIGIPLAVLSGLVFLLGLLFTMPDVAILLAAPGGSPVPVILTRATGSRVAGTILQACILINGAIACVGNQFVCSRTVWSFARDDALPFSKVWARVDSSAEPRNALFISTLFQMLILLMSLGSSSAFNAFLNVGIMGVTCSYGLPIALNLFSRRRHVLGAPWHFNTVGLICNIVSVIWVVIALPVAIPVTPVSMNYAPVILVAIMAFSLIWYLAHARKVYTGPPEAAVVAAREAAQMRSDLVEEK